MNYQWEVKRNLPLKVVTGWYWFDNAGIREQRGSVLRNCDIALEIIESITNRQFDFRTVRGSYLSTAGEKLKDKITEDFKLWCEQNKNTYKILNFH